MAPPSEEELAELTALHHEVACLAESFGRDLPNSLHEQLETVEHQVDHVLELSEVIQSDDVAEAAHGTAPTATAGTISARKPHEAELAAERVFQKLLRNSGDLDTPVVLACVKSAQWSIKCPATNFGALRAVMLDRVPLAHCVPPQADTSLRSPSVEALKGNLAVVRRGAVPVSIKAQRVQDAGAVGLILINSDDHAWLPFVKNADEQAAAGRTHIPIVIVPKSAERVLSAGALVTLVVRELEPNARHPVPPARPGPNYAHVEHAESEPAHATSNLAMSKALKTPPELINPQPTRPDDQVSSNGLYHGHEVEAGDTANSPIDEQYRQVTPQVVAESHGPAPAESLIQAALSSTGDGGAAATGSGDTDADVGPGASEVDVSSSIGDASASASASASTSADAGAAIATAADGVASDVCADSPPPTDNREDDKFTQAFDDALSSQSEPCYDSSVRESLHSVNKQLNDGRLEEPNRFVWPNMTDAASTAAVLQSGTVALDAHCQRLLKRVQALENDNHRLRQQMVQQQQQHEREKESLASEVAQWMKASNRAAEQLAMVNKALEETTVAATNILPEPKTLHSTCQKLQLVPAPEPGRTQLAELSDPASKSMSTAFPSLGCMPAAPGEHVTPREAATQTQHAVPTAKKPRNVSVAEEQAECRQTHGRTDSTSGVGCDLSLANDDALVGSDVVSESKALDSAEKNECETACDGSDQKGVEDELSAVAAQVQALEEFQAQAMAGLHRLHNMKSAGSCNAIDRGELDIEVIDASPGVLNEAAPMHQSQSWDVATSGRNEKDQSPCLQQSATVPREIADPDEASVEELLALQAQAQAMVEAMASLQTQIEDIAPQPQETMAQPQKVYPDETELGSMHSVDGASPSASAEPTPLPSETHGSFAEVDDDLISSSPRAFASTISSSAASCSTTADVSLSHRLSGSMSGPSPPAYATHTPATDSPDSMLSRPLSGMHEVHTATRGTDTKNAFRRFTAQKSELEAIDATIAESMAALQRYAKLAQPQQQLQ